jgi:hypothetical protein
LSTIHQTIWHNSHSRSRPDGAGLRAFRASCSAARFLLTVWRDTGSWVQLWQRDVVTQKPRQHNTYDDDCYQQLPKLYSLFGCRVLAHLFLPIQEQPLSFPSWIVNVQRDGVLVIPLVTVHRLEAARVGIKVARFRRHWAEYQGQRQQQPHDDLSYRFHVTAFLCPPFTRPSGTIRIPAAGLTAWGGERSGRVEHDAFAHTFWRDTGGA